MRWILAPLFALPFALSAQTLHYGWPGIGDDPCTEWISCPAGCSACNTPIASDASLIGTAAAWVEVSHCPHPKGDGDSVVETAGWTAAPDAAMIIIGMVAIVPLQVDSIIIDHLGVAGGCERLQVRYGTNIGLPTDVIKDVPIAIDAQRTVITNAGCIVPSEGGSIGTAQLVLQAYAGGDGWQLDNVRIVTSACSTTGIGEVGSVSTIDQRPVLDLMGRPVGSEAVQGVYLNARHQRVVVLP